MKLVRLHLYRTILLILLLCLGRCLSQSSTFPPPHHNQRRGSSSQSIDALRKAFRNAGRLFWHEPFKGRGSKTNSNNRIVGGSAVASGTYPSYVHTREPILCGGTLIYEDVILTAAHCAGGFLAGVVIGGVFRNGSDATIVNVDAEFPHPDYSEETQFNDMMLVKLTNPSPAPIVPLNFDSTIPIENETLTVIGYGNTAEDGDLSDILLEVDVDTYTDDFCFDLYIYYDPMTMVCAGSEMGGRDSCQGDSGGPIFNDMMVQVGVVASGSGCGKPNKPAIYTEVSAFETFIQDGICDISDNPPLSCLGPTEVPSSVAPSVSPFNTTTLLPTLTSLPTTVASASNPPSAESPLSNATSVPTVAILASTMPTSQNLVNATLTSEPTLLSSMTAIPAATIRPSSTSDAPDATSIPTVSPFMSDSVVPVSTSTVVPTSTNSSTSNPTVQSLNTIAPSTQTMAPNSTTATNQPTPAVSTTTGPTMASATTLEPSVAAVSPNETVVPTTAPVLSDTMMPSATFTILPTFSVSTTTIPTLQSPTNTIAPSTLSAPPNGSTSQPTSLFSATSKPTSAATIEPSAVTMPPKRPTVVPGTMAPSAPPEILQMPIASSTTRPTKTVETTVQPTEKAVTTMPSSMVLEPVAPAVPAAVPTPRQAATSRPIGDAPTTLPPSLTSPSPFTDTSVTFTPTYIDAILDTITPVSQSTRRPTSPISASQAPIVLPVASTYPTTTTLLDPACPSASKKSKVSDKSSKKSKRSDKVTKKSKRSDKVSKKGNGREMGTKKGKGKCMNKVDSSGCTAGKGKGKGKSKQSGKSKGTKLDQNKSSGGMGGKGSSKLVSNSSKSEKEEESNSNGQDDDDGPQRTPKLSVTRAKSMPLLDATLRAKLISIGNGI